MIARHIAAAAYRSGNRDLAETVLKETVRAFKSAEPATDAATPRGQHADYLNMPDSFAAVAPQNPKTP